MDIVVVDEESTHSSLGQRRVSNTVRGENGHINYARIIYFMNFTDSVIITMVRANSFSMSLGTS